MEAWWEEFFRGPWERIQLEGYPEERTNEEVSFLVDALRLLPGAAVLDVPCGEGRHSIELARRGYRPTGIDFNENAIAVARERAEAAGAEVDFRVFDMRRIDATEAYDGAFCFFGSFGYFSDAENLDFARRVARALKPHGSFLIDLHVAESLYPQFRPRDWSWIRKDPPLRLLEERTIDLESGRIESTWSFVTPDGALSRTLSIRLYGYRELRDLLITAGFGGVAAYQTGSMEPFRFGSSRCSMVASKGGAPDPAG